MSYCRVVLLISCLGFHDLKFWIKSFYKSWSFTFPFTFKTNDPTDVIFQSKFKLGWYFLWKGLFPIFNQMLSFCLLKLRIYRSAQFPGNEKITCLWPVTAAYVSFNSCSFEYNGLTFVLLLLWESSLAKATSFAILETVSQKTQFNSVVDIEHAPSNQVKRTDKIIDGNYMFATERRLTSNLQNEYVPFKWLFY